MTLLEAIASGDAEALDGLLTEDVTFHSPVQTYRGRRQVRHLLVTIGGVIDDVEATREVDGVTFFAAKVEEHPVDGVLVERAGDDGRIAEITLMLRPLAQLQAAVARMARALAERDPAGDQRRRGD
jgi:ketosteroid isomerase-like protein